MASASLSPAQGSPPDAESLPGTTGTPAAIIVRRAWTLSPIAWMAAGDGPTQASPASCTAAANSSFSERKP
ncbi:MAG: hypothetical protein BWY52_01639 [Chloroflexi bacterium ADurb.Bin325]|nr:MAG: hypothetical protein BWY52_01639 [Chloroflexi bacterium ADurb.Bin325]